MSRIILCSMVLMVVLETAVAAAPVRDDASEEKAVALVEKLGGKVTREKNQRNGRVIKVSIVRTNVTDSDLREHVVLERLAEMDLCITNVTDAGLKYLAPIKNLASLTLTSTSITDSGLTELAPLKNLTRLGLFRTTVTDKSAAIQT